MNKLNFQTLGIVTESENHVFRDDGFVPSIDEHTRKLYKEFKGTDEGYEDMIKFFSKGAANGRYMHKWKDNNHIWIIFYEPSNAATSVFRRGHEETHVLHGIGQIKLLQQRLTQRGLNIDLGKYDYEKCGQDERDIVANLGALYVIESKGVDISRINPHPYLLSATSLYQSAIIKKKN